MTTHTAFWGLWLFLMGYLVFKSGFFPRILGILLMLACFGHLINSFAIFLGYAVNVGLIAALGEVLFILWLLIKDVQLNSGTGALWSQLDRLHARRQGVLINGIASHHRWISRAYLGCSCTFNP